MGRHLDNPFSTNCDVVIYQITRVAIWDSSSPYLLNSAIQHHLKLYSSSHLNLVVNFLELFYVDDAASSD